MEKRLDVYVAERENISRSASVKLIENNCVFVNNSPKTKSYIVLDGDNVDIVYPDIKKTEIEPENIPLDIVYEDNDLLVVNKPKGMVVHPSAGHFSGTLVNALLWHCGDNLSKVNCSDDDLSTSELSIGGFFRPGIVHRIDMDTSGLLVVAKNDKSHIILSEQLKEHKIGRHYETICVGNFKDDSMVVNKPIGRHPTDRKKMAINSNGKEAITHFILNKRYTYLNESYSYLTAILETGRTHQIRVHLSSINRPCLGDNIYGGNNTNFYKKICSTFNGQCLHAKTLEFIHPSSGELMKFTSNLPEYFINTLNILESYNE